MAANQDSTGQMLLAHSLEELKPLYQMCREGRLYDVARWIDEGKPLQVAPQAVAKGTRHKAALQIALETGQHSLVFLILSRGYQLDLERAEDPKIQRKLDMALASRTKAGNEKGVALCFWAGSDAQHMLIPFP